MEQWILTLLTFIPLLGAVVCFVTPDRIAKATALVVALLTTGKPVKIISKLSLRKPTHYYEIQIDTKRNKPEILNGRGDGVDIPPGEAGNRYIFGPASMIPGQAVPAKFT